MTGWTRLGSQGLELEAVTAAFLGGCAMAGGKGTVVGALLAVAILGVLNNGMILTAVPTFYQMLAKGTLAAKKRAIRVAVTTTFSSATASKPHQI